MKYNIILFIVVGIIALKAEAQKGNNEFSFNAEAAIPGLQDENGFGGFIKYAYGIGQSGQLTISAGFAKFVSGNSNENDKTITRLIPFLLGYKKNIHHWFIEPRAGLGEMGGKITMNGDFIRPSVAALFYGIGGGYTAGRFSFGLHFQAAHGIENSSAGSWYNRNFYYTGVFIGYSILQTNSSH